MKSTIFHKFKKEKGAVEFIESSIIYPFIFISISILLFIFLSLINKMIIYESLSSSSYNIYQSYMDDNNWKKISSTSDISIYREEKIIEEKLNRKIFSADKGQININLKSGFLLDKISIEHKGYSRNIFFNKSSESKIIDNRINQVEFLRKTDLVFDLAKEISNLKIKDKKIKDYFKNYKNKFDQFIKEKVKI